MIKELTVLSGKGGTGKTSLVASFAALAGGKVVADCDVDAADLHLVLEPVLVRQERFSGGSRARILPGHCTACGKCQELCRFDAVFFDGPGNGRAGRTFRIDPALCEGCGVCAEFCAEDAIRFAPVDSGQWFISQTRHGPMVHARLGPGESNSGKLVSLVRSEARKIAKDRKLRLVLIDGSPGIGCPVIASVAGADLALVVTEPTLSGLHDLGRATDLTRHFGIRTLVCVNKWDLNEELTERIEAQARDRGLGVVERVRYDRAVTDAQILGKPVVELADSGAAEDVRRLWVQLAAALESPPPDGSVARQPAGFTPAVNSSFDTRLS